MNDWDVAVGSDGQIAVTVDGHDQPAAQTIWVSPTEARDIADALLGAAQEAEAL